VLLSGEGSDELFAGYEHRYRGALATLAASDRWRRFSKFIPRGDPARASRWQRFASRAHHSPASEIAALQITGVPGDVRTPRGLTPDQLRDLDARTRAIGPELFRPQRDLLSALLCFDLDWQLAESLLQKADKMSMAASIELRTPILDREVATVASRIPSELKLPERGPGKFVLRQSLARRLQESMDRPKKGFPVPLAEWFRGPLRAQVEAETFALTAAWRAHLDPQLIEQAWKDQLAGAWDGARFFYSLWLHTVWERQLPK
jgi:asparagine synthase (glutamine-hydrolysing)